MNSWPQAWFLLQGAGTEVDEADTLPYEVAGCPVETPKPGAFPSLEAPSAEMLRETFHNLWSEPATPFDTRLQYKKQFRALVQARQVG